MKRCARIAAAGGCLLWIGAAVAQGPTSGLAGGTSDGYSSLPSSQQPPASRGNTPSTGGGPTTQTGKATKDQDQSASATSQDQTGTMTATVEQIDRSKHTIKLGGMDKTLRINPQAEVTRDGSPASFADIREGDQVRASFTGPRDDQTVSHVDIVGPSQSGTGSRGATSNGGGSGTSR